MTEVRCDICGSLLGEITEHDNLETMESVALYGEDYGIGPESVTVICKGCVHHAARKYPNPKVLRYLRDMENDLDSFITEGPTGSFKEISRQADKLMGEVIPKLVAVRTMLGDVSG